MKTAIKWIVALGALTAFCYGYSAVLDSIDLNSMPQTQSSSWGIAKDRVLR